MTTDKEIIKAFEKCVKNDILERQCINCDYFKHGNLCMDILLNDILNFINRQQAEKEALIAGQETMSKCIAEQQAEIERLQNTVIALSDYLDVLGIDKTDTSTVRIATELNALIRASIKSEARKEFAERLKEDATAEFWSGSEIHELSTPFVTVDKIDNLLKKWRANSNE